MLQSKEQIGKLDRRIVIQQIDTDTPASNEKRQIGWTTFATVWARVEEKHGSEYYKADKLTWVTVADFNIRHLDGLDQRMRIVYNSTAYGIEAIIYDPRKRFIKITAESGGEYVDTVGEFEFTTEFATEFSA